MKYSGLTILKMQTGGDLILTGSKFFRHKHFQQSHLYLNEVGTLLVYDISLNFDSPQQVIALSFEYGGVSKICWLDTNHVAVGMTQGRLIVFSIKNEIVGRMTLIFSWLIHFGSQKWLVEISTVKVHSDRATHSRVQTFGSNLAAWYLWQRELEVYAFGIYLMNVNPSTVSSSPGRYLSQQVPHAMSASVKEAHNSSSCT